jgi:hypothetical protein
VWAATPDPAPPALDARSKGADALGRALSQSGREFPPTAPNGPSVQAGDPRQQRIPAAAKALGLERDEPAALLLIPGERQAD